MGRSKVTLKFNKGAFAEIRTAPKVMAMLDDIAEQTARRAGDGFEAIPAEKTGGRVRGRAAVVTATTEAMEEQSRNRRLERSLGGGSDD
jgi:hypothetical protein